MFPIISRFISRLYHDLYIQIDCTSSRRKRNIEMQGDSEMVSVHSEIKLKESEHHEGMVHKHLLNSGSYPF